MKICFVGAGAVGGYLAAHLARVPDIEVSLLARGATLEAVRANGLKVVTPDGEFVSRPRAETDAAALGPQDYVFITLKADQIFGMVDTLAPLVGPETTVLPPTTGLPYWYFYGVEGPLRNRRLPRLDPEGRQWTVFGPERALGCVYWIGAQRLAPGVIRRNGAQATFPIGEPDGSRSPRLVRLHEALKAGGVEAPMSANIRADLWMKMISSMVWNPIAVLTTGTLGQIAAAPGVLDIAHRMTHEAEQMAAALGITMPVPKEQRIASTVAILKAHKLSMLQDLENGRQTELDIFVRSIADLHELIDVPTPTLDTMLSLTRLRLSIAGLYQETEQASETAPEPAGWWTKQTA